MTTPRFNPEHGADYGRCNDCGVTLATERDARAHMSETFEEAKAAGSNGSHAVRVLNPSRPARIKSEVSTLISDAIQQALSAIDDLICRHHITEQEATDALQFQHLDLTEEWEEYNS